MPMCARSHTTHAYSGDHSLGQAIASGYAQACKQKSPYSHMDAHISHSSAKFDHTQALIQSRMKNLHAPRRMIFYLYIYCSLPSDLNDDHDIIVCLHYGSQSSWAFFFYYNITHTHTPEYLWNFSTLPRRNTLYYIAVQGPNKQPRDFFRTPNEVNSLVET